MTKSIIDEFHDRAMHLIPAKEEVSYQDLVRLWESAEEYESLRAGYSLRPDLYDEERIVVEDHIMNIFGFDPDWREY